MEKERQEPLEWFVQFANMNLDQLGPGDKAKFWVESEVYLFPTKRIKEFDKKLSSIVPPEDFIDFAGKMLWAFQKQSPRDTKEFWTNILLLQNIVIETFEFLPEIHPAPKKGFHVSKKGKLIWSGETFYSMNWDTEKYYLSLLPLTDSHEDYIRLTLFQLLDGLSRATINKCPICKKYFLNTTLRKKRFCSPKCIWRFNAKKRRETDPEAYKKYQKELMQDKYRIQNNLKPKKFYQKLWVARKED